MTRFLTCTCALALVASGAWCHAHEPPTQRPAANAPADDAARESLLVRQIDLKLIKKLPASRSKIVTPVVIKSQEELENVFNDRNMISQLAQEVDLKTDNLLYFAWNGSGQDTITTEVTEVLGKPPHVDFHYKAGRTRDLRPHRILFMVKKNASWKVDNVR